VRYVYTSFLNVNIHEYLHIYMCLYALIRTYIHAYEYISSHKHTSFRSTSVVIWIVGVLVACEMVSTFLRVPLSSTLAFGGVGGLAIGLSARDIAANFLGMSTCLIYVHPSHDKHHN
jgi:small-conductance mechanosensitive channel